MKKCILILIGVFCICVHLAAQNTFVFLGSYNWDKSKEGIYVYQLDTASGHLTRITSLKGYQSTFGNHPRTFAIDPSGKFIIVTNVVSHTVTVFKRNLRNGQLTKVFGEPGIANVSCVQVRQY